MAKIQVKNHLLIILPFNLILRKSYLMLIMMNYHILNLLRMVNYLNNYNQHILVNNKTAVIYMIVILLMKHMNIILIWILY